MKKHIITISGLPGSGKSSTAQEVGRRLGLEHFSSGDFFRKMAEARDLSIEQANITAEGQKGIDLATDAYIRGLGETKTNFVIDSRTAFHWIPDSFKVFLDLQPEIAAERVFAQIQKEGRLNQTGSSVAEIYQNTLERTASERKRYQNLYGIDFTDKANYDLFVDTSKNTLTEVVDIVCAAYKKWLTAN